MVGKGADGSDKSHGEDFYGITDFEILSPDLFPGFGGSGFQRQFIILLTNFATELFPFLFQCFQRSIGAGFLENPDSFIGGFLGILQDFTGLLIGFT